MLASTTLAANYYVSSNGNDNRTPLEAQSQASPWKTLERLDSVILYPGDSVLLRRGDTLRGTLTPRLKANVTWTSPMVVAAYGPSVRPPLVLGTTPVTGWLPVGGNETVWEAPFPGTIKAARLLVGGRTVRAARYPAAGWLTLSAPEGDTALVASELLDDGWVGSTIHLKTTPWNLDARRIVKMSGRRVSLHAKTNAKIRDGWGYFVTDHPRALCASGQWVQDSLSNVLRLRPATGQSPALGLLIEVSTIPSGVNAFGKHDITIEGIDFQGQTEAGIDARGTFNVTIRRCRAYRVDQWGFKISGRNSTVEDSRVVLSSTGGIDILGAGCRVLRDTVEHIGDFAQFGPRGHGGECCGARGMEVGGDSCLVQSNVVRWTGWSGITFGGKSTRILDNSIDSALQASNDGGGLYSYGSKWDGNGLGSLIRGNIVTRTLGNTQGSPNYPRLGVGLYFDNMVEGAYATGNSFVDNGWGVLVHNNRNLRISKNTIVSDSIGIVVHRTPYSPDDAWGNSIDSNLVLAVHPGVAVAEEVRVDNHGHTIATYLDNLLCSDHPLQSRCARDSALLWERPRLELRKRATKPERFPPLASGLYGWRGYPNHVQVESLIGTTASSQAFQMRLIGDTLGGIILRDSGVKIDSNDLSYFRFKAKAGAPGMQVQIKLQKAYTPYTRLAGASTIQLDTVWKEYGVVFTSSASDSSARIDFVFRRADSLVSLSDLSWRGIDTIGLGALRYSSVVRNSAPASSSYSFGSGPWLSPLGNQTLSSGSLPPRAALFAFKDTGLGTSVSRMEHPDRRLSALRRSGSHLDVLLRSSSTETVHITIRDLQGRRIYNRAVHTVPGTSTQTILLPAGRGICFVVLESVSGVILETRPFPRY